MHPKFNTDAHRRRFLAYFSGIGLGSSLLPGVLWAQAQEGGGEPRINEQMIKDALAIAGLTFSEEDVKAMVQGVNRALSGYEEVRKLEIPNDVEPPFYFSPITPGMKVNRARMPLVFSAPVASTLRRPANMEDLAFASVVELGHLLKARKVTSTELTEMYLARLHKLNGKLNCVV